MASQFLALSQDQRLTLASFVAGQLAGYVDDAGMAVLQENHFLFAIRQAGVDARGESALCSTAAYTDQVAAFDPDQCGTRLAWAMK